MIWLVEKKTTDLLVDAEYHVNQVALWCNRRLAGEDISPAAIGYARLDALRCMRRAIEHTEMKLPNDPLGESDKLAVIELANELRERLDAIWNSYNEKLHELRKAETIQ